jgi:hypothetical protein
MPKFNTGSVQTRTHSPLRTAKTATGTTYEGHPGYSRDTCSELFLLAVSNFVGENTFYEKAQDRDNRFVKLVREAAEHNPLWTADFLAWLRSDGNMRSASIVGAAEYADVNRKVKEPERGGRSVVNSVLQRADEPGEMLAYWTSAHGKAIPKPIKRGVADAVARLYTERNLLKYDSDAKGYRFGDVLDLAHPSAKAPWQGDLYKHALDRRHNRDNPIPESLRTLHARAALMAVPVKERRAHLNPDELAEAGMTWEACAGWLQGPMDKQAWEAVIPNMGVMALIRNLRNFDEAQVSDEVAEGICKLIADPEVVAKSRQLPYRWFSAYREISNDRWRVALGKALDAAMQNIPALPGRTLILVDTSGSMSGMTYSARSKMSPVMSASLFGVALASKCGAANVELFGFADRIFAHKISTGGSVLREVERFAGRVGEAGHGTQTAAALHAAYKGHDRVVIITDEQAFQSYYGNVTDQAQANIPIYAFNMVGYQTSMLPDNPNRHQLGGITDATFRLIPQLEAAKDGKWPWVS